MYRGASSIGRLSRVAELLLVDNDTRITELIAWFLVRRGHNVRSAASFVEARARIDELRPDLMLSDVDLGAESARDELPALAREGRLPPTLVLSGYLDRDLSLRLGAVPGVVGTLAKPFDFAVLEARIDACLALATNAAPTPAPADDDGWVDVVPTESKAVDAERERSRLR